LVPLVLTQINSKYQFFKRINLAGMALGRAVVTIWAGPGEGFQVEGKK
jgi:hypothetical protein